MRAFCTMLPLLLLLATGLRHALSQDPLTKTLIDQCL
jgi:hypothetical protein